MAEDNPYLTNPTKYNIADSNIALLGSDVRPLHISHFSLFLKYMNDHHSWRNASANKQATESPHGTTKSV